MSTVVVASSREDAAAVEAVENHHAQLSGALRSLVDRVTLAAGSSPTPGEEREALAAFARTELLPHAAAEEETIYLVAHADPAARLLVDSMTAEHGVIRGLVEQLEAARTAIDAAAYGRALQVFFDSHLTKENDLVLPLLAGNPEVSVAGLLDGMHELLGADAGHHQEHGHASGEPAAAACSCGHEHSAALPELDARAVPHDIRHATIFGALSAVAVGGGMVLIAPHDPLPLLAQIEQREPGGFAVEYLERGPEAWRLVFTRLAS